MPQTQGARRLYLEHLQPFLRENENAIDDFITSAHSRAKSAGLNYLKQLIELAKTHILGLPPRADSPLPAAQAAPQSYAQSLLARFNLPAARPTFPSAGFGTSTADVYSLLANAVAAYASGNALATTPSLVPPTILGQERKSFIEAQRERLQFLLRALEREAAKDPADSPSGIDRTLQFDGQGARQLSGDTTAMGGNEEMPRTASGQGLVELGKSMSVGDFEKIDEMDEGIRRAKERPGMEARSSSWMPWSWGAKNPTEKVEQKAQDEGRVTEQRSVDELKEGKGTSSAIDTLL